MKFTLSTHAEERLTQRRISRPAEDAREAKGKMRNLIIAKCPRQIYDPKQLRYYRSARKDIDNRYDIYVCRPLTDNTLLVITAFTLLIK